MVRRCWVPPAYCPPVPCRAPTLPMRCRLPTTLALAAALAVVLLACTTDDPTTESVAALPTAVTTVTPPDRKSTRLNSSH